jgi:hypothetical protein
MLPARAAASGRRWWARFDRVPLLLSEDARAVGEDDAPHLRLSAGVVVLGDAPLKPLPRVAAQTRRRRDALGRPSLDHHTLTCARICAGHQGQS